MDIRDLTIEENRALHEIVLLAAKSMTKSVVQAEEITQEAYLRALTTRKQNPEKQPSIAKHLAGVARSLLSIERKSARRRVETSAGEEQALLAGGATPSPETLLLDEAQRREDEAEAARHIATLRTKLANHELELAICDHLADDVTKPADLVKLTGRTHAEVDAALRRIRRTMKNILAAERGETEEEVP